MQLYGLARRFKCSFVVRVGNIAAPCATGRVCCIFWRAGAAGRGNKVTRAFVSARLRLRITRVVIGRRFDGGEYTQWGGVAGKSYRLVVEVVGMGDGNAVDITQTMHEDILIKHNCFAKDTRLYYGFPLPTGPLLEGIYIDDRLVCLIGSEADLALDQGPDRAS